MRSTIIIKEISYQDFKELVKPYLSYIFVSPHALDRLSDTQRKMFTQEQLIYPLLHETLRFIGRQENGRYALFFRRPYGFLRIVIAIKIDKLEIVTFINTKTIPRLNNHETS